MKSIQILSVLALFTTTSAVGHNIDGVGPSGTPSETTFSNLPKDLQDHIVHDLGPYLDDKEALEGEIERIEARMSRIRQEQASLDQIFRDHMMKGIDSSPATPPGNDGLVRISLFDDLGKAGYSPDRLMELQGELQTLENRLSIAKSFLEQHRKNSPNPAISHSPITRFAGMSVKDLKRSSSGSRLPTSSPQIPSQEDRHAQDILEYKSYKSDLQSEIDRLEKQLDNLHSNLNHLDKYIVDNTEDIIDKILNKKALDKDNDETSKKINEADSIKREIASTERKLQIAKEYMVLHEKQNPENTNKPYNSESDLARIMTNNLRKKSNSQ